MATLTRDAHEPRRSPYWIACFNGVGKNGQLARLKRSTKQTDKKEAQKIADKWEQTAKQLRQRQLSAAQARKVVVEMYQLATGKELRIETARSWLGKWAADQKPEVSPRTAMKYDQFTREFIDYLGSKADEPLNQITEDDLKGFLRSLKSSGHSRTTVNNTLKVLRMPLRKAHRKGYIDADPCVDVKTDDKEDANVEKDVFATEQVKALIEAAPSEDWKGAILCGYYTALRLRDVTELRWSAIDAGLNKIEMKVGKTGKKIVIPIHSQLAAWLKKQTRGIGKAPVFPSLAGKSGAGRSGLSMAFKRIMESAKIQGRILRERNGAGRSVTSLSFHSLRHSFNSALHEAGVDQEIRMALTGHSTKEMNELYTHRGLVRLQAAVNLMPSLS